MNKRLKIFLIILGLVFVGLTIYGIKSGDAQFVLQNAKAFCFS